MQTLRDVALDAIERQVLFSYQKDWVRDRSKFKICNKARQIGISLMLGLEGALDVLDGEPVFYVSRTERQSIYLLEKFYKWVDLLALSGFPISFDLRSRTECRINGVDIKSLTSEAVAGEGFSGNVYLDEFGLHDNDTQIYRSLFPVTTWGYKLRIVSRPFGQSNMFWRIWSDERSYPDYSRHEFDIYRAIKDGAPHDLDELKRNLDSEGFAENYECKFLDESTSYFPYELLRANLGEFVGNGGTNYIGVDVGRKRDATIILVGTQLEKNVYVREIVELKGQTFSDQKEAVRGAIQRWEVKAGCIDSTGLGSQISEELHEEFSFLEPVWFTNENKSQMTTNVKGRFESHTLTIPDNTDLINDCHSIRKKTTASNNIVFDAVRNESGHADRYWALALMLRSLQGGFEPRILFL